jgi:4-alpha-glucanotransferase
MIDWCHKHQLSILQTLPINEISDDNSPYNALSSLAIEPTTIAISPRHIPDLTPGRFKELAGPELLSELRQGPVNYPAIKVLKRKLLEAAFENFIEHYLKL